MAASIQCRPRYRSLGLVMKEVDEDLALFLELSRSQKEKNVLLQNSYALDETLDSSSASEGTITATMSNQKPTADDFLTSEDEKHDYDWLLSSPGVPSFHSAENGGQKSDISIAANANTGPTASKSTATNPPNEPAAGNDVYSQDAALSNGLTSTSGRNRRPSLSGQSIGHRSLNSSRSATPTGHSTVLTTSNSKHSRPSTPTSRATFPSMKPRGPVRSSTPTRPTARSSTPTARVPVQAASMITSRSKTPNPNHQPSAAPYVPALSGSVRPSSGSTTLKNPPLRGKSPTVKSRHQLSEMPCVSHDASSNSRTSEPKRTVSASRNRVGAIHAASNMTRSTSNGKIRQKSCSPTRGRAPGESTIKSGSSVLTRNRGHSNGNGEVNPVMVGTKMVERVVNMRKLAPPKLDGHCASHEIASWKSSSLQDNSGFGRMLSKSSLDMAIRHMDIRRSISGSLRPVVTKSTVSTLYGVRLGSNKSSRATSVSDSPVATSSNTSSEPSANAIVNLPDQIEVGDCDSDGERTL